MSKIPIFPLRSFLNNSCSLPILMLLQGLGIFILCFFQLYIFSNDEIFNALKKHSAITIQGPKILLYLLNLVSIKFYESALHLFRKLLLLDYELLDELLITLTTSCKCTSPRHLPELLIYQ